MPSAPFQPEASTRNASVSSSSSRSAPSAISSSTRPSRSSRRWARPSWERRFRLSRSCANAYQVPVVVTYGDRSMVRSSTW